jgi:cytochrome P450
MLVEMIDKLVDPVTPLGRAEVVDDLAGQLPARFTAWLLGLDEDEWWSTMKRWSEEHCVSTPRPRTTTC